MLVGVCEVELLIYDSNSLKEKRQVIKSLVERIKSRFNVSIAEISEQDIWNKGVIGFAVVGNTNVLVDKMIASIINFIDNDHRVEIINKNIEVL